MKTTTINVERVSVISAKTFVEVVKKLEAAVGHPDMRAFSQGIAAAQTDTDLEQIVHREEGPTGLMIFMRLDLGEVLRKEKGREGAKSLRLLIGNPIIMRQMARHIPDAGSYAPVTILVDERPDGVHLSYDRMASYLSPYRDPEAMKVARELDAKVESLLAAAAS